MPQPPTNHPFTHSMSRWFFAVSFLFLLWLGYLLVAPFLVHLFLAVVLAVVGGPIYEGIKNLTGGRRSLASAVTCLLFTLIVVLPFFWIITIIARQALDLYTTVSFRLSQGTLQAAFTHWRDWLEPYREQMQQHLGITEAEVVHQAGELLRYVSDLLYSNLAVILRGFTNLIVGFLLVIFITFYLFMDGARFFRRIMELSPLAPELNQSIMGDILTMLRATLRGTVVLAMLQGLLGGMGFGLLGVPNASFWGTLMVFASVVPLVGTALVWLPAGIYLLAIGQPWSALGVSVWCLLASFFCDNILRPRLVGGRAQLHPLLIFFSILGGLSLFGVVGLILGPLVLAVLLSLVDVYQRYFLRPVQDIICPPEETDPQVKEEVPEP